MSQTCQKGSLPIAAMANQLDDRFFCAFVANIFTGAPAARSQILRQRKEIQALQRAGIPTGSAEELLARMRVGATTKTKPSSGIPPR
jgi:hypothetical protein